MKVIGLSLLSGTAVNSAVAAAMFTACVQFLGQSFLEHGNAENTF